MKRIPGILIGALIAAALLVVPAGLSSQQGQVLGRVVDGQTKQPVKGALVLLEGTAHFSSTDSLGHFRLNRVPVARHRLQVRHIGYSSQSLELEVSAGTPYPLQIAVTATAIALEPVTVDAVSADERRERGAGYRRSIISRGDIERAMDTNLQFGELLRLAVPTVSVRRLERMGSPVCIELRMIGGPTRGCLAPAVYLDGVRITDPAHFYDNLDMRTVESIEVVPSAEAGVLYGSGALFGAILITSRRPGAQPGEAAKNVLASRPASFNWSQDTQGHSTMRVFATTALGNGMGLAIGVSAAAQCVGMRKPAYDGLISDCSAAPTIGSAAAAVILPALASSLASRWSGRTQQSQGLMVPAAMGTVMTIVPAYALVFSGYRNDSENLKWVGYSLIVVGAPIVTTAADYLFRELRGKGRD
jgi:carboxypeptidase-like protein/TonB-dependent receptor-like protein